MIDIHSHILPGIDDGAKDIYDSMEMLRMSESSGVTEIVATPHCNIPHTYENYFGKWYVDLVHQLQHAAAAEGLGIRVMPGAEAYTTDELPSLLRDGKIMTLNQSHYLLMEFGFEEDPDFAEFMLESIASLGVKPVIAHIERYHFIQDAPEMAFEWRRKGYVIQVNKGSLFGHFGPREEQTAHRLLRHNLVSVIASDGHSPFRRTTRMDDAKTEISMDYSERVAKLLLLDNPKRIVNDQPILALKPIPFEIYEREEF